ncbi:SRPBCC family protein [Oxalobacter paraformigenes]|uniref:DUF1857 family protein n=1 Tax=Oxalobacter paraformigenes TaxID=556268 RepID=C3X5C4_9BURK|nr:SRPBCC family protein [Oxalobacter paraformigenes]EEO28410.1 hypothetical protein OFAG_01563 [Oxalobacter paraformigenes]
MKFEHLIEINNFDDPRTDILDRKQLWHGLLLRAKEPTLFIPHMDSFEIVEESDHAISRILNFGKFRVNDKVEFVPMQKLSFYIPAQGEIIESKLEISIDEPFPGRFFVRFIYEDSAPDEGAEAMYNDFRRSAYKETDIDSIRLIRQFAAQGRLNGPATDTDMPLSS